MKKESEQSKNTLEDKVNNPPHYLVGGMQPLDYMKAKASRTEFLGYLRLTVIKYLSRAPYKKDLKEDLYKAQFFMNKLIIEMEENDGNG